MVKSMINNVFVSGLRKIATGCLIGVLIFTIPVGEVKGDSEFYSELDKAANITGFSISNFSDTSTLSFLYNAYLQGYFASAFLGIVSMNADSSSAEAGDSDDDFEEERAITTSKI
jgi:hypothetical protein